MVLIILISTLFLYVYVQIYLSHPVDDAGWVQVFDSTQHLVEQVGHSLMVQLHLNDLAEVCVHQLHDQVTKVMRKKCHGKWYELYWPDNSNSDGPFECVIFQWRGFIHVFLMHNRGRCGSMWIIISSYSVNILAVWWQSASLWMGYSIVVNCTVNSFLLSIQKLWLRIYGLNVIFAIYFVLWKKLNGDLTINKSFKDAVQQFYK